MKIITKDEYREIIKTPKKFKVSNYMLNPKKYEKWKECFEFRSPLDVEAQYHSTDEDFISVYIIERMLSRKSEFDEFKGCLDGKAEVYLYTVMEMKVLKLISERQSDKTDIQIENHENLLMVNKEIKLTIKTEILNEKGNIEIYKNPKGLNSLSPLGDLYHGERITNNIKTIFFNYVNRIEKLIEKQDSKILKKVRITYFDIGNTML